MVVLRYAHKFFGISPFKRYLILLSLSVDIVATSLPSSTALALEEVSCHVVRILKESCGD